jgi:hypothetical protein
MHFQVTGDSHGASAFRESAFRPPAAGSRHPRLMAEKPKPEFPTPMAVTRHLEMSLTFAPVHKT